tara:strand:- start:127 stop:762 length:636 start_codon:yes stop_codon:yes gene_type:complete
LKPKKFVFNLLILVLLSSCKYRFEKDTRYFCKEYNLDCVKENIIVTFATSKGNFDVELFGSSNPLTVSNFIKNISDNIYENSKFYKLIDYPNTKIIHGGIGINNNNQFSSNNKTISSIPLEISLKTKEEPLYKTEISDPRKYKFLKNSFQKGSISMAKISKTKSSSTEFFISTEKSAVLEGRYSVFGKIINGFEILENIGISDFILKIEVK